MVKIAFQIKRSASDAKLQRTAVIGRCMPRLIAQIALRPLCPSPAFFQPEQHRGQKRVQRRLTGFVFPYTMLIPGAKSTVLSASFPKRKIAALSICMSVPSFALCHTSGIPSAVIAEQRIHTVLQCLCGADARFFFRILRMYSPSIESACSSSSFS